MTRLHAFYLPDDLRDEVRRRLFTSVVSVGFGSSISSRAMASQTKGGSGMSR